MIYRVGVINAQGGISPADFRQHWINVHGSLARELPGLRSYRQNHVSKRLFERQPFPMQRIDGYSQLLFDDIAAMERVEESEAYAACKLDIPKFQGDITILVTSEIPFASEAQWGAPKLSVFWRSREGNSPTELEKLTAEQAVPFREAMPTATAVMQNIVVDRAHPVAAGVGIGTPNTDGFLEYWFEDTMTLIAAWNSRAAKKLFLGDGPIEADAAYEIDEITIMPKSRQSPS